MKSYRIEFEGRLKNSIGITSNFVDFRVGKSKKEAIDALYDKYEHIHVVKIQEVIPA